MSNNDSFKYEIVQNIVVLSTTNKGWTKELNLVSFNDAPPKYDLRTWDPEHQRMGKGITFSKEEMLILKNALEELEK